LSAFITYATACSNADSYNLASSAQSEKQFVQKTEQGLTLGERTFFFSGANQYYFFYKNQQMIDDVLEDAKALGLNTIRTWAFCEGDFHDGYCFQPEPGVYHEPTFQNLDYAIYKASTLGIKLILTLSNNWGGKDHFGGIDQYLEWVGGGLSHDDFYKNEKVGSLFKNYVKYVLNRENSITKIAYKDDPTILAWELMNEPRADDKQSFYKWVDDMAGYIKDIDPNHLVGSGSEGAYATDFYETHKSKNIDMASLHLYPDWWNLTVEQSNDYIREHIRIAKERLHKPIYLGEFGFKDKAARPEVYREWYKIMDNGNMDGALFWLLSGTQYGDPRTEGTLYPDYDGFTVYYPESKAECGIISAYSQSVADKNLKPQFFVMTRLADKPVQGQVTMDFKVNGIAPIKTVAYQINNGAVTTLTAKGGVYSFILDSTLLKDGMNTLLLSAEDSQGLKSQQSISFYVNNEPGQATLVIDGKEGTTSPDFGEIYAADGRDEIYFLLHRYEAASFATSNYIYIDIDNNPATGEFGYDHRIDYRAAGDNPQGHGDVLEWYYWNGAYWSYGRYWQAADPNPVLKGNRAVVTLPTGTLALSPNGMLEFRFPKKPASGTAAGALGMRFWMDGAYDSIGSREAPFFHPYSSSMAIKVDGAISTPDEWDYKKVSAAATAEL
jgi:mannan endo-1,4-beta-mannosidase